MFSLQMIFLTTFFNFWRYKMKKTMIAMAVAGVVAAPIASAEVSISGTVEQTFTNTEGTGQFQGSSNNQITFSASEDLGNGMSAFGSITLDTDSSGSTTSDSAPGKTWNQVAGVKGAAGTVVVGRMEDFTESKIMSMMDLEGTTVIEATGNAGRYDDAIAYVSPTVNGLHFGVAGYSIHTDTVADDDTFDATDMAIFYDNGPLSIKAAVEKANGETAADIDVAKKTTSVGASYTVGNLKASAVWVEREDFDNNLTYDSEDLMARVDYTMGNNKITIASLADENNSSAGAAGTDAFAVELNHTLSNKTKVYVGFTDEDGSNNDDVYAGIKMGF